MSSRTVRDTQRNPVSKNKNKNKNKNPKPIVRTKNKAKTKKQKDTSISRAWWHMPLREAEAGEFLSSRPAWSTK